MQLRLSRKTTPPTTAAGPQAARITWAKRLGAFAFLFFLAKGLLWLAAPAAIVVWRATTSDQTEVAQADAAPQVDGEESRDARND